MRIFCLIALSGLYIERETQYERSTEKYWLQYRWGGFDIYTSGYSSIMEVFIQNVEWVKNGSYTIWIAHLKVHYTWELHLYMVFLLRFYFGQSFQTSRCVDMLTKLPTRAVTWRLIFPARVNRYAGNSLAPTDGLWSLEKYTDHETTKICCFKWTVNLLYIKFLSVRLNTPYNCYGLHG